MIYSQHCELHDMAFLDLKVSYSKVTTQHFFTFPLSDICFAYFFFVSIKSHQGCIYE